VTIACYETLTLPFSSFPVPNQYPWLPFRISIRWNHKRGVGGDRGLWQNLKESSEEISSIYKVSSEHLEVGETNTSSRYAGLVITSPFVAVHFHSGGARL
jgi:hypothetical protein